jgi:hypothetical protein
MKLLTILTALFAIATKGVKHDEHVSKLNDSFEGNAQYWRPAATVRARR